MQLNRGGPTILAMALQTAWKAWQIQQVGANTVMAEVSTESDI